MNPDFVLVRRFISAPGTAVAVDSNALAVALGASLDGYDAERRELSMYCEPGELFRQGAGVVQGGALAAMLDFAMAFAGFTQVPSGSTVSTLNLNVAMQRPATAASYRVLGRIDKPGRRAMFASAEITGDRGVIASATSTLLVLPIEQE